jgi:hypothetical protein
LNAPTTTIDVILAVNVFHANMGLPTSRRTANAINVLGPSITAIWAFIDVTALIDAVNVVAPSVITVGAFD